MIRIQALLMLLVALGTCLYLVKLRSTLGGRLLVLALAVAGMALIAFPRAATALAGFFGVGRGVDLVLYLALLAQGFVLLMLFSAVRELREKLVDVARELALSSGARAEREETLV